jgi:hypothetical protein
MKVLDKPEALFSANTLDANVANIVSAPPNVSCTQGEGDTEYSLQWGEPLETIDVYALLRAAAPNFRPADNTPRAIIDDWQEPDRDDESAAARIRRHEKLLGQNWDDFMRSRLVFMEVVGAVPQLNAKEQEVRQLTGPDEKAAFAAAYLVHASSTDTTLEILENADLDTETASGLFKVIGPFLVAPERRGDIGYSPYRIEEGRESEVAEALKQKLLELPEVTEQVIQSTIKPALKLDYFGLKQWDYRINDFQRKLISPSGFFAQRYCVQAVSDDEGNLTAIPFAKQSNSYVWNSVVWLIPEWGAFHDFEGQDGSSRRAAPLVNPVESEYAWPPFDDRAVISGSLRSAPGAPKVRPSIEWRTSSDGTAREFILKDEVVETEGGKVIGSGLFGLILAAALQPEITTSWPKEINGQAMGIAQLPVLALMHREQLATSPLLQTAEQLAAR